MTYICGYQDNRINFIICDTRVTFRDTSKKESLDVVVKSGYLFPGCIFARAGDMTTSAKFITSAKNRINPQLTPKECWEQFVDFVDEYPFSKAEFTLLLSTRAFGQPKFYCLNSKEGLQVCQSDPIIDFGSGQQLLNSTVENSLKRLTEIRQQLSDDVRSRSPDDEAGYFMCHHLSLYAQSYRKNVMAKYDVGGIFHFMAQTDSQEYRQRPSLYLATVFAPTKNNIYLWMYRVASVLDGIIVETYFPPGQKENYPYGGLQRDGFFDTTSTQISDDIIHNTDAWQRLSFGHAQRRGNATPLPEKNSENASVQLNKAADQEFRKRLQQELESLEWSYYCGWGFVDPKYWGNYGWQFNPQGSKAPITPEGEIDETLANDILKQIRNTVGVKGVVTLYFPNKSGRALQTEI